MESPRPRSVHPRTPFRPGCEFERGASAAGGSCVRATGDDARGAGTADWRAGAEDAQAAQAHADGQPRVRRLVDAAWSGGAVPVIVVAPDTAGAVATALAGSPATLAEPAPKTGGPVGQIARGIDVAHSQVNETDAALVWPVR